MPSKMEQARRARTKMIGQKPDSITVPTHSDTIAHLKLELQNARQKLKEKQAANDDAGVARMMKIIENLQQTINRN